MNLNIVFSWQVLIHRVQMLRVHYRLCGHYLKHLTLCNFNICRWVIMKNGHFSCCCEKLNGGILHVLFKWCVLDLPHDDNGWISCRSPHLVALGIFGAWTKLKSAANDLPYIARWCWAYLGSAMLKPAKSLIEVIFFPPFWIGVSWTFAPPLAQWCTFKWWMWLLLLCDNNYHVLPDEISRWKVCFLPFSFHVSWACFFPMGSKCSTE